MHMHSGRALLLLASALALLIAGCTTPAQQPLAAALDPGAAPGLPPGADPGSPAGGGRVLNAPPRVLAFQGSLDRADNGGGSVEVFRATVADDNAEGDILSLALVAQGPERFALSHAITAQEAQSRADPGFGPDGWAVWDAAPQDGLLQVAVRFTYPYGSAVGTYAWTLQVRDGAGSMAQSKADSTTLDPVHVVEVEGAVRLDGSAASADGWGGWAAAPGARDVPSETFLKVVNKGTHAGQRFVVDFSTKHFLGTHDRAWKVPLDGNVRFAAWEAMPGQAPADGRFAFGDVSPDGSITLEFTRAGAVMFIAYEVAQVPSPLPSQVYYASATVTAL
jgi:hypothetical protein